MTLDAGFSASILFYLAILFLVAWGALLAHREGGGVASGAAPG
jgi:hypothetical protein